MEPISSGKFSDINILDKLSKALTDDQMRLVRLVASASGQRGFSTFLVGGIVRDLLLDYPPVDFDIVVEGEAISLAEALVEQYGGRYVAHRDFHTATWYLEDSKLASLGLGAIDLVTARSETYRHPAALPTVHPASIHDDLHRRDFTINSLAVSLDKGTFGRLMDELQGAQDLEKRSVRVLHDQSFVDDPTRIFRAVRYEQRYRFHIESHTLQCLKKSVHYIEKLSAERLRHELNMIFDESNPVAMLKRLNKLDVFDTICDFELWSPEIEHRLKEGLEGSPGADWGLAGPVSDGSFRRLLGFSLWMCQLTDRQLEALQKRIHFPNVEFSAIRKAALLYKELPELAGSRPSRWANRLADTPLISIYVVFLLTGEVALHDFVSRWRHIRPRATGNTLRKMGLSPSPVFKNILGELRAAWLDGEVTSGQEEKQLLEKLVRRHG